MICSACSSSRAEDILSWVLLKLRAMVGGNLGDPAPRNLKPGVEELLSGLWGRGSESGTGRLLRGLVEESLQLLKSVEKILCLKLFILLFRILFLDLKK